MRTQTALAATTALVGSLLALGGSAYAEPGVDQPAVGDRYVAFGDSFVSGPGILPQSGDACARSGKNFPSLVAADLGVASFVDASCSGAKATDLFVAQGANPPQLEALSADTTLVTFGTLGGNDMGLVGLATGCLFGDCAGDDGVEQREGIASARDSVTVGIRETKSRSPQAEIYVVGYSTYLPPGGCPAQLSAITPAEADQLQGLIDELSDALADVAAAEDVAFVDMREIPGALDHTVCAEPTKQWIRAGNTYNDGAPLHPSACGMAASAQQVSAAIRQARGLEVPAFEDSCVSAGPAPAPEPEPDHTAERLAALEAAAVTTRLAATCRASGKKVRARVRGGKGAIARVRFAVGDHRVSVDRSAPYRVTKRAGTLLRHREKIRATVVLADADLKVTHPLAVKRPGCLRRR